MSNDEQSEAQNKRIKELEALVESLEREAASRNDELIAEREKVKALNTQALDAQYVVMELSGCIREYEHMQCESLRSRLFSTLHRYQPRIDEHRRLYQAFQANDDLYDRLVTQARYEKLRPLLDQILTEALAEAETKVGPADKDDELMKVQQLPRHLRDLYFAKPY